MGAVVNTVTNNRVSKKLWNFLDIWMKNQLLQKHIAPTSKSVKQTYIPRQITFWIICTDWSGIFSGEGATFYPMGRFWNMLQDLLQLHTQRCTGHTNTKLYLTTNCTVDNLEKVNRYTANTVRGAYRWSRSRNKQLITRASKNMQQSCPSSLWVANIPCFDFWKSRILV
jgi:hypothetical protein